MKFLRQVSQARLDDLAYSDEYAAYIMTHGVSGIQWSNYKAFLPENVYQRYIEKWGDVNLTPRLLSTIPIPP